MSACEGDNYLPNSEIGKLRILVQKHEETFVAKGVDLFLDHTMEYIPVDTGGSMEFFRSIEFVDHQLQPPTR